MLAFGSMLPHSVSVFNTIEIDRFIYLFIYLFQSAVLARFPAATLAKIDSTLIFLAFGSLSLVILIGIGMSFNAFRVVFPNFSSNESIEYLITNVLTPSFTPTLLLFFLFSITYGLFKFAQVSSDSSVYKE